MRIGPILVFVVALVALPIGCRDGAQTVQKDQERFGVISPSRPVGAPCAPGDTASITRRPQHPLGPTGGWRGAPLLDLARSYCGGENQFLEFNGAVRGYVRFLSSGELRIRSYDDVYGAVYCGFSPTPLRYEVNESPVFVRFPTCAVGDGGLDQVTEICWFPEGSERGSVVYSSAHPAKIDLTGADVYRLDDLVWEFGTGVVRQIEVNGSVAETILRELFVRGNVASARELVGFLNAQLPKQAAPIGGESATIIPSRVAYCDTWLIAFLADAALSVRTDRAIERIAAAQKLVSEAGSSCRKTVVAMLPHYRWLVERLSGSRPPLPGPIGVKSGSSVHGYDPGLVTSILGDPLKTGRSLPASTFILGGQSSFFWLGIREFLADNVPEARRYWEEYRREPNSDGLFELGVLAVLER